MNALVLAITEIIVVVSLLQASLSFDLFDAEHHQELPPVEDANLLTLFDDQEAPSNGLLSYVLPDRRMFKLPIDVSLLPFPRAGRVTEEEQLVSLLLPHWCNVEADLLDKAEKSPLRLIRKKRSLSGEESPKEEDASRHPLRAHLLDELSYFEPSLYFRQGRRPSSRSRNSFVPRVGKRVSEDEEEDADEDEIVENSSKRAKAFTPRIGRRASLIPRIGRGDPRFKVKSRGAFIPRIGRRAILTPRIGRSQEHHEVHKSD